MAFARLAAIPLDHVRAEMGAFPLASESSLRLHPVSLDPQLSDQTGSLWRDAERALLGAFPGVSVDEGVAWRDRLWFRSHSSRPVPLAAYLRHLASLFLSVNGAVAVPRWNPAEDYDGVNPGLHTALARRGFLWLSFALPPDLLLAASGLPNETPERVEVLSPTLTQMLQDQGYAETHLHVGAALEFPTAWIGALHAVARTDFTPGAFESPGAGLDEGRLLGPWLVRAVIARLLLAEHLSGYGAPASFAEFLRTNVRSRAVRELGIGGWLELLQLLGQLRDGQLGGAVPFPVAKDIYARLGNVSPRKLPEQPHELFARDPIAPFVVLGRDVVATPEVRFVRAAMTYLTPEETRTTRDELFASLFWQYVRVRNLLYRHVVQRPMTPGLQWFIRFYDRGRPLRSKVLPPALQLRSAALIGGAGRGLRSIEIRTAPDPARSTLLGYVDTVRTVATEHQKPKNNATGERGLEWGVVYHFPKLRAGGAEKGLPAAHWRGSHGDPGLDRERGSGNPSGYRFARFYMTRLDEAMSLEWLLRRLPRSLEVVRGVDVCTDELGVPNWVLAPLVARVHRAAADGAVAFRRMGGARLPRFRTTVHAGEDFVHLLTGLRHVDEAIDLFHLNEGDRIGHGLALGVDPADWARRAGCVPMPREERLFDLAWEWSWCARQMCPVDAARQVFVERQIAVLSHEIFGRRLTPLEFEQLRRDLSHPFQLWRAGFPDGRPVPGVERNVSRLSHRRRSACLGSPCRVSRLGLLYDYLSSPSVFERGRESVLVETQREAAALAALQSCLRRQIGSRGLTVEVNPTSNLLIGDLGDLGAHPLWRMRPPRGEGDAPPVAVCIGSDDPLVFASNLRLEYQWLSDALVLAGLSSAEADAWLSQARTAGLNARFTLPRISSGSGRFPVNLVDPTEPMMI